MLWEMWKKGFDAWEDATARYMERWLESPLVLVPSGQMMKLAMQMKAQNEKRLAGLIGGFGLPTKHDQERTLHMLARLESRLADLEEKLDEKN